MACVMARIWDSVNEPRKEDPRCPLVPKINPLSGVIHVRPPRMVLAFEPGQIHQHFLGGGLPASGEIAICFILSTKSVSYEIGS